MIDATETFDRLGNMVNDGKGEEQNCNMKLVVINNQPHLCLFAVRDIQIGEELLYDYGDNFGNLWWRKQVLLYTLYFYVTRTFQ
jgi:SET domain-containing protein